MELESEKEEFKGRVKVLEEDLVQSRKDQSRLQEKLKGKVGEMVSLRRRRGERILSAELEQRLKERIELRKELKKMWETHEGLRGSHERALREVERMKHSLENRDLVVATLRKSLEEAEEYGRQVPGLQKVLEEVRHRLEEKRRI
ncbi:hypothetical protein APHAL10511_003539, partial [Amanita phalloides]